MTLMYFLGLLGLIGVGLLILIYILKPKYQEKALSSTFIWKLTLKYKKRKNPFQWITASIVFILQIIILVVLAIMMASPLFFARSGTPERIVIIDGSAQMHAVQADGRTRFSRALFEVEQIADTADENHLVTVIYADENPRILGRVGEYSPAAIRNSIAELRQPSFGSMDIEGALTLASPILLANGSAEVILITARNIQSTDDITVLNIAGDEVNLAILNVEDEQDSDSFYVFHTDVASFGEDKNFRVELWLEGSGVVDFRMINAVDSVPQRIALGSGHEISSFTRADVRIVDAEDAGDSFAMDNSFTIFGEQNQERRVHLISARTHLWNLSLNVANTTVVPAHFEPPTAAEGETPPPATIDNFTWQTSGFQLYIFDGVMPDVLPQDGAVWFINPRRTTPGAASEPILGGRINLFAERVPISGVNRRVRRVEPITTTQQALVGNITDFVLNMITPAEIHYITNFQVPAVQAQTFPTTSLLTVGAAAAPNQAMITWIENGQRMTFLPFDLEDSTLHINFTFMLLTQNLLNYSIRESAPQMIFDVGAPIQINSRPNTNRITVEGGLQEAEVFAQTGGIGTAFDPVFTPTTPGLFTITHRIYAPGGIEQEIPDEVFVRVARSESEFTAPLGDFPPIFRGPEGGTDARRTIDILFWLALVVLAVLAVEWFLQYKESA